ncbi:MAG: metal ABC transporter substrate-binding protein [Leptospiraceae bacterium]|nr:metal ABC transporter substrate-binding protein [Leptospiraceae bacterium]MDW7976866.1 metal ABC transporter substrate-binding protein [Leptospiraceae bacterium]
MKRWLFVVLLFLPISIFAKIKIVTTLSVLKHIAEQVGGNKVQVESLIPSDVDPHFADARPDYILKLNQADLLVYIGMDLEVGWLPKLIEQSRNPKIYTGMPGNCDVSVGIQVLEKPTTPVDRSMGDIHIYGNPHYWLDPLNAVIIARNIKDHLQKIDNANANYYEEQYLNFSQRIKNFTIEKIKQYQNLKGVRVAVHHREFIYFLNRFGFVEVTSLEEKPGVPPSASYLLKVVDIVKAQKVQLILIAPYNNPKYAQFVSERTGVKYVVVPTNITDKIPTYEKLMETILETISKNI